MWAFVVGAASVLACLLSLGTRDASAATRPPAPVGVPQLAPGQLPTVCAGANGGSGYSSVSGVYYDSPSNSWLSAPFCYPRWGNLEASPPQIAEAGKAVTVTATPTDGSNSGTYAPQTASITWTLGAKVVSGCLSANLTCTFIPAPKQTHAWQWLEVEVSMPRTFFIDSPGEFCAGVHVCAGVETHAWTWIGVPPDICPGLLAGSAVRAVSHPGPERMATATRSGCGATLSGHVFVHKCVGSGGGCDSVKVVGADGRSVSVAGPSGHKDTLTDANGFWQMKVPRGNYTVRIPGAGKSVQPASRSVRARGDVRGLDFDVCKPPPGYTGKHLGCDLVEIRGTVLAFDGTPYGLAHLSAPGDFTNSDAHGHFAGLLVPIGLVFVTVRSGTGIFPTEAEVAVNATRKVNTVRVTLPIKIQIQPARAEGGWGVALDGLPRTPVTFHIQHNVPVLTRSCVDKQDENVSASPDRSMAFPMTPQSGGFPLMEGAPHFCRGLYTATVVQGTRTLATTTFVIS
jgi:hypothetical protein